ncbi:MAG: cytochrome c3 family protein [Candidatus Nealsonbacteria bacterium]|nr:cytochrome c3 family protein [Candidatus Nealsonbacteria bacterium]
MALVVAGVFVLGASLAAFEPPDDSDAPAADSGDTIDPLSTNATCYVCHTMFVREPISKVHFKAKVTCIDCHGLSAAHANDEDVGATKPDVMYKRGRVDKMCSKCHKEHDVPAAEVIGRFIERKPAQSPAVCTDCHGRHKIEPPEEDPPI